MLKNTHSSRSFTAFLVTWAFAVLTVSGIVLYIVPQGRIAYWLHWSLFGLGKDGWGELHMLFGGIFIVAGALHLYFNWKPFKNYLAARVAGQLTLKRELLYSLLATLLIGTLSVLRLPPASWVFELNAYLKDGWSDAAASTPPFGHAEELSQAGFAKRQGIDLSAALQQLSQQGVSIGSPNDSLESIARANAITPASLYAVIKPLEQAAAPVSDTVVWSATLVEERFAGTGIGRKSLTEIAALLNLPLAQIQQRLALQGVAPEPQQSLRELAEARGSSPIDLMKQLLIDSQAPR